mmetsp:Transcript_11873/g.33924  ORF Transcript_11873/g.33924 Transcript_11873/m.33924 type:complete len:212 (+) Transcript_11873:1560-2195(+)
MNCSREETNKIVPSTSEASPSGSISFNSTETDFQPRMVWLFNVFCKEYSRILSLLDDAERRWAFPPKNPSASRFDKIPSNSCKHWKARRRARRGSGTPPLLGQEKLISKSQDEARRQIVPGGSRRSYTPWSRSERGSWIIDMAQTKAQTASCLKTSAWRQLIRWRRFGLDPREPTLLLVPKISCSSMWFGSSCAPSRYKPGECHKLRKVSR